MSDGVVERCYGSGRCSSVPLPPYHQAAIVAMDVDENTSSVITGSLDGSVKTWSYDGRLLDSFDGVAERVQSREWMMGWQGM